jgi:hypothetical protein
MGQELHARFEKQKFESVRINRIIEKEVEEYLRRLELKVDNPHSKLIR